MHRIILSKSVIDFLETKDEKFIKDFYKKIKYLENDKLPDDKLDIKKFKGKENRYRLRIGKHRFMYEVIE